MLAYAHSLVGIPYRWWNPTRCCCDTDGPFWAGCFAEVPRDRLEKGQVNCAGLLNALCLYAGLEIPGRAEHHIYAGGTGLWWEWFEHTGRMEPYVDGTVYPPGSVLLRKFRMPAEDEGHVAIVVEDGNILHAWPGKGVVVEKPAEGYYERVVRSFLPCAKG